MDNNSNNNNIQNYKTVEAEILGDLRKDKIGKPVLVIVIFGLLLLVLIGLPFINDQMNNENGFIYKYLHKDEGNNKTPVKEKYADASKNQALSASTSMKMDTVVLKNFSINGNMIKFTMFSYNGLVNLNESEYYLIISTSKDEGLSYVKLTGVIDFQENEVTYTMPNFNANSSIVYYGKVKKMTNEDYPEVNLSKDTLGISTLVCRQDTKSMTYTFKNDYLIKINEYYNKNYSVATEEDYNKIKEKYQKKASLLGSTSAFNELISGFTFTSNIDLEIPGYMLPDELNDYDYYPLDTLAKRVHYEQTGKGYECK